MKRDHLTICHTPRGWDHPYQQEADERSPRDPQTGESIVLGVTTQPAGAVERVWAEWSFGEGESCSTPARLLRDETESSLWQVALPASTVATRLHYTLYGQRGDELVQTERFAADISTWVHCRRGELGRQLPDDCELIYRTARPDLYLSCRLTAGPAGALTYLWQPLSAPAPAAQDQRGQCEVSNLRICVQDECGLLQVRSASGALVLEEASPPALLVGPDGVVRKLQQSFACMPDEAFYGFGERFNALDQRGGQLDIRVYDQYREQGTKTYVPVPFQLSSCGYGLYHETTRYVQYDLASADPACWTVTVDLGSEDSQRAHLIVRDEPLEIVQGYAALMGKPVLPPAWAFGLWMSSNDWNSQRRVMEQLALTQGHAIPVTVLVIEAWSDEATFYIWNDARCEALPQDRAVSYTDFTFPADGRWPDPKQMCDELHADNVRLVLWQIPVLKNLTMGDRELGPQPQRDADEAHMIARGYCVKKADGTPYRVPPIWFAGSLVLDFTNPEAVDWWMSRRAYLLTDIGIDDFKTDGGEHLWGDALLFADGRRGDEIRNLYPNLYQQAYHRFVHAHRDGDALLFSRAGFAGAQASPCHWAGDQFSTWQEFRSAILAGLNANISGIPFWGWDIGGFSGEIPSAELYLRSAAMAVFCPIMQYHSDYNGRKHPSRDRTPWNIQQQTGDERVIPIFRKFANLRMNLLPTILSEAWHTSQTASPLMRALPLAFAADPAVRNHATEYLLGSSLLVAPVTEPDCERATVYLPAGRWVDLWTDTVYTGPGEFIVKAPLDRIPVFVPAGALLALDLADDLCLGGDVGNRVDRYRNLCFKLYPGACNRTNWHDATTGQQFEIGWDAELSNRSATIHLPVMPHDLYLIVPATGIDALLVNDRPLPRAVGSSPVPGSWSFDPVRKQLVIFPPRPAVPLQITLVGLASAD